MQQKGRPWALKVYISAVVAIPLVILALRLLTGEIAIEGWGWLMFSY